MKDCGMSFKKIYVTIVLLSCFLSLQAIEGQNSDANHAEYIREIKALLNICKCLSLQSPDSSSWQYGMYSRYRKDFEEYLSRVIDKSVKINEGLHITSQMKEYVSNSHLLSINELLKQRNQDKENLTQVETPRQFALKLTEAIKAKKQFEKFANWMESDLYKEAISGINPGGKSPDVAV